MKKTKLENILNGDIQLINDFGRMTHDPAIKVVVLPVHVKNMLLMYLNGVLSADSLSEWATFVLLCPEYACDDYEGENNDDIDYYEDMWHVIQCLSTPMLDGEITLDLVKVYLNRLDKYF